MLILLQIWGSVLHPADMVSVGQWWGPAVPTPCVDRPSGYHSLSSPPAEYDGSCCAPSLLVWLQVLSWLGTSSMAAAGHKPCHHREIFTSSTAACSLLTDAPKPCPTVASNHIADPGPKLQTKLCHNSLLARRAEGHVPGMEAGKSGESNGLH